MNHEWLEDRQVYIPVGWGRGEASHVHPWAAGRRRRACGGGSSCQHGRRGCRRGRRRRSRRCPGTPCWTSSTPCTPPLAALPLRRRRRRRHLGVDTKGVSDSSIFFLAAMRSAYLSAERERERVWRWTRDVVRVQCLTRQCWPRHCRPHLLIYTPPVSE